MSTFLTESQIANKELDREKNAQRVVVAPPSEFGDGEKTVAASSTPEKLSASSVPCSSLVITPLSTNTQPIYWGYTDSAPNYIASQLVLTSPSVANLSDIYIKVSVNGEGCSYSYTY